MRATINGLSFDEWPRDFDESFVIEPEGLTGWFGGLEPRREESPRPLADGSFDARTFMAARIVGIQGHILASSKATLISRINQLNGLLSDGSLGRLTVQDDHGNATWADVRLASATKVTRSPTGLEASFQVQFWAPDPRRYGELRSFANGSNVFHRGNAPAFPVVRINSGAASYDITWQGRTFRVSGAPSGGVHRVDMRTGRLTRNGVPVLGAVVRAETSPLPPGARWSYSVSAGSGVTVEVHDTFY